MKLFKLLFNKIRRKKISNHFFDVDGWISKNDKPELDIIDILHFENKIKYILENDLVPKGSVLYYLLQRGTGKQPEETKEERVIRLLKKDFEKNNGISFDEFMLIYNEIITTKPEMLI